MLPINAQKTLAAASLTMTLFGLQGCCGCPEEETFDQIVSQANETQDREKAIRLYERAMTKGDLGEADLGRYAEFLASRAKARGTDKAEEAVTDCEDARKHNETPKVKATCDELGTALMAAAKTALAANQQDVALAKVELAKRASPSVDTSSVDGALASAREQAPAKAALKAAKEAAAAGDLDKAATELKKAKEALAKVSDKEVSNALKADIEAVDKDIADQTDALSNTIGETVKGDYFEVTLNKVAFKKKVSFRKAEEDSVFLVIDITAKCVDKESRNYSAGSLFAEHNGNRLEFDDREFFVEKPIGQLNPLTKKRGTVVFKIPTEVQKSPMTWYPGRGFDRDKHTFKLEK